MIIGRIYKIVCDTTGEVYIGSTTKTLKERLAQHRHQSNSCSSKQIIDRENYHIELIEEVEVENKTQLRMIEAEHIKNTVCVNRVVPYRSPEEKKELNNRYAREYQRGDKFKIYTKNYYHNYNANLVKTQCSCGGTFKYKNRHFKTKMHTEWEQSQSQNDVEQPEIPLKQQMLDLLKQTVDQLNSIMNPDGPNNT